MISTESNIRIDRLHCHSNGLTFAVLSLEAVIK